MSGNQYLIDKLLNATTTTSSSSCMSCEISQAHEKFTKVILSDTCTFCSWWCQCDYVYDVKKGQRGSFYRGYEKQKSKKSAQSPS